MRSVAQKAFALLAALLPPVSMLWPHGELRDDDMSFGSTGLLHLVVGQPGPILMVLAAAVLVAPLPMAAYALLRTADPWWGFIAVLVATGQLLLQTSANSGVVLWDGTGPDGEPTGGMATSDPGLGLWVFIAGSLALILAGLLVRRPSGHGSALRQGLAAVAAAMCVVALFLPTFLESFRFDEIEVPIFDLLAPWGPENGAVIWALIAGAALALAAHGGSRIAWIPLALVSGLLMTALLGVAIAAGLSPDGPEQIYPGPGIALIGIAGLLLVIAAISGIVSAMHRRRRDRREHATA